MSGINGIGGQEIRVREAAPAAPSAAVSGSDSDGDGDGDTLKAIQGLIKQLEVSANTKAIPAHQNW